MSSTEDGSNSPQSGENTCPDCAGTGRRDGDECATCRSTGTVVETVGDG